MAGVVREGDRARGTAFERCGSRRGSRRVRASGGCAGRCAPAAAHRGDRDAREGASLAEIAQVLRHREIKTTAIYAKVDRARLRPLAMPWPGGAVMTDLRFATNDYLAVRRQLGFELQQAGRLLEDYVDFMDRAGAQRVTTELALMWATSVQAHPHRWRRRLGVVRGFARYLSTIDPARRDSLRGSAARLAPARRAVPLLADRDHGADERRTRADTAAARGDVRDDHRAAGGQRPARRRGARP